MPTRPGFTGSKIWPYVAMFPPVSADVIDAGYEDFARRWNPILDVFDSEGVRYAHEVHPGEIAYLAQVAENKALAAVFEDLFHPIGSEIFLRPASDYVVEGSEVDFYTIVEAARRRYEVAIGYRLGAHANDARQEYGVVINPTKGERRIFAPDDKIIVLAEN